GIESERGGICCPIGCSKCGGKQCVSDGPDLPRGSCCGYRIRENGEYCDDTKEAPCIIGKPPVEPPVGAPVAAPVAAPYAAPVAAPYAAPVAAPAACHVPGATYGDNKCDQELNNAECDYDGGDCCFCTCDGDVHGNKCDKLKWYYCKDPDYKVEREDKDQWDV
ncbi:unnamed protein product, partial [Pylaiella littoralis]